MLHAKKAVYLLSLVLLLPAAVFAETGNGTQIEDCGAYCRTSSGAIITCETGSLGDTRWQNGPHDYHETRNICTNYSDSTGNLEGFCDRSFLNGGTGFLDCSGTTCSVLGKIPCGGTLRNYEIGCSNRSTGAPRATAGSTSASCEGTSSSNAVSCGVDGNLFYSSK